MTGLVFVASGFVMSQSAFAQRLDQRAADLYDKGVRSIQSGRFKEGEHLIHEAVRRGAVEPNEAQGSETRFLVRKYDPYYWLGVARMETGAFEDAYRYFEISESFVPSGSKVSVITKWTNEYRDLRRRKRKLLKLMEGAPPRPAPIEWAKVHAQDSRPE